ncbi:MAG: hypothetical protein IAE63_05020 [Alphaproteobacteria bacterium]|nr:hypothetical protein [Alphaproteobacteria bacterium]
MSKTARNRGNTPQLHSVWTGVAPTNLKASSAPKSNILSFPASRSRKPSFLEGGPQTAPAPKVVILPALTSIVGYNARLIDAADSVTERGRNGMNKVMAIAAQWGLDTKHMPKSAFAANAAGFAQPARPSNVIAFASRGSSSKARISVGGSSVITDSFGAVVRPFRSPLSGTGLRRRTNISPTLSHEEPKLRLAA